MSIARRLRDRGLGWRFGRRGRALRRSAAALRRQLSGKPPTIDVFLGLEDPYSCLLGSYLGELTDAYAVDFDYHLTDPRGESFRDHPDLRAAHAIDDCRRLAAELGVPFLDRGPTPPIEHRRALAQVLVADREPDALLAGLAQYWRGDSEAVARRVADVGVQDGTAALLATNQVRLARLGHYDTATLWFDGEWYWGVDRLRHLVRRLDQLGLRRADAGLARVAAIEQAMRIDLPVTPPAAARNLPPLELFFSFRSPYSYLAVGRVLAIAGAFRLKLRLRPVMPMVNRGVALPRDKLRYILTDTSREAELLGIPFGRFADPLGAGVERLMATFCYARSEHRDCDFLRHAMEAVWSLGVDVATDKGLRKVTARTGLFWPDVVAALASDAWREEVEANAADLYDAGYWGVPTLRLGDFVTWGQDRCWLLAREVEDHCDTGEGILI